MPNGFVTNGYSHFLTPLRFERLVTIIRAVPLLARRAYTGCTSRRGRAPILFERRGRNSARLQLLHTSERIQCENAPLSVTWTFDSGNVTPSTTLAYARTRFMCARVTACASARACRVNRFKEVPWAGCISRLSANLEERTADSSLWRQTPVANLRLY